MTEPESTDRTRAPERRWQSSARWTLVAVLGVTLLGGFGFYALFLRGDATPPPPARPATSTSFVATTVTPTAVTPTAVTPTTAGSSVDATVTTP